MTSSEPAKCLLADGYFVLAAKSLFQHEEVSAALQSDFFCTVGDVGKLPAIRGATLPTSLPASPHVFVRNDGPTALCCTAWSPFCPILCGGKDLLREEKPIPNFTLSSDDIVKRLSREIRTDEDRQTGKNPLCYCCNDDHDVGEEMKDFLFGLFPSIQREVRDDYFIFMINTLQGCMNVPLGKIVVMADQPSTTHPILESIVPMLKTKLNEHAEAEFVPYYRREGGLFPDLKGFNDTEKSERMRQATKPSFKNPPEGYMAKLNEIYSMKMVDVFPEEGTRDNGVIRNLCASDVYKLYPRTFVGNQTLPLEDYMKLYEAILLNKKLEGNLERSTFAVDWHGELDGKVNKANVELATLWLTSIIYTSLRPDENELLDCQPRLLKMRDILEQRAREKEETEQKTREEEGEAFLDIIDNRQAGIVLAMMDESNAAYMRDFRIDYRRDQQQQTMAAFEKNLYVHPVPNSKASSLVQKIFQGVCGHCTITFVHLIRFLQRDLKRLLKSSRDMALKTCNCGKDDVCLHQIIRTWRRCNGVVNTDAFSSSVTSSSEGMQKRLSRKRKGTGVLVHEAGKRLPHTSGYTCTMRCTSSRDLKLSPFGSAAVVCQKENLSVAGGAGLSASDRNDKEDEAEKTYRRSIDSLIAKVVGEIDFGLEDDANSPATDQTNFLQSVGVPDEAVRNVMAFSTSKSRKRLMPTKISLGGESGPLWNRIIRKIATSLLKMLQDAWNAANGKLRVLKEQMRNPEVEKSWSLSIPLDPNLDQQDGMCCALYARGLFYTLLPPATLHVGMNNLLPGSEFPVIERTAGMQILEEKNYRFNGNIHPANSNIIPVGLEASFPSTPIVVNGPTRQAISIGKVTCKMTSMFPPSSGKSRESSGAKSAADNEKLSDVSEPLNFSPNNENEFEELLRRILQSPFEFEPNEEEGEERDGYKSKIAFNSKTKATVITMEELKDLIRSHGKWVGNRVDEAMLAIVVRTFLENSTSRALAILPPSSQQKLPQRRSSCGVTREIVECVVKEIPEWQYTMFVMDAMCSKYAPSFFNFHGRDDGLPLLKYFLAYSAFCRQFNVQTGPGKQPLFTRAGFVGPCVKSTSSRRKGLFYNYGQLGILDAPTITFFADYTIYPASFKNNDNEKKTKDDKMHGGPVMKRCNQSTSGIVSSFADPCTSLFTSAKASPLIVMMTPTVTSSSAVQSITTVGFQAMSLEKLLGCLYVEKDRRRLAQVCMYDDVDSMLQDTEENLKSNFVLHLCVDDDDAELIVKTVVSLREKGVDADEDAYQEETDMDIDDLFDLQ